MLRLLRRSVYETAYELDIERFALVLVDPLQFPLFERIFQREKKEGSRVRKYLEFYTVWCYFRARLRQTHLGQTKEKLCVLRFYTISRGNSESTSRNSARSAKIRVGQKKNLPRGGVSCHIYVVMTLHRSQRTFRTLLAQFPAPVFFFFFVLIAPRDKLPAAGKNVCGLMRDREGRKTIQDERRGLTVNWLVS